MQYVWLGWSLAYLFIWFFLFALRKDFRKEMLWISFWTMPLGLTEPLFVPGYWNPASLFDLAHRTGFDIESLIFAFAIGGIGSVLYNLICPVAQKALSEVKIKQKRHHWHWFILFISPLVFILLFLFTTLNPIYNATISMFLGALATLFCRPDLKKKIWIGGALFLMLYFIFFVSLIIIFPNFVQGTWNLGALTGIFVLGIPIEELLFAFAFGMLWSGFYEHFFWLKLKND
jgi:hypothetical protein